MHDDIARAASLLRKTIRESGSLLVTAGAGMGVDSGLPDFRGREGLWRAYPALAAAGLEFTRIASPGAFRRTPRLAWGFYGHRLALYRATKPHAGFGLLRALGAGHVFTSNVDGHFAAAGFPHVYECHGSIHYLQCLRPCSGDVWPAEGFHPQVDTERCELLNDPPLCPRCGLLARPNILMFGDEGWIGDRYEAQSGALMCWLREAAQPLTVIELGAGTAVPTVRYFGESLRARYGARLLRINPREPHGADLSVAAGALEALTAIVREVQGAS